MGLNSALAIAGRSLEVFTTGIEVAGNNIANANTPGYIREQLHLNPSQGHQKRRAMVVGGGVLVDGIRQEIDKYLETRIHASSSDFYGSQQREDIYKQLEATVNELSDGDLSTGLNDFLGKIQDFANQPEVASRCPTRGSTGGGIRAGNFRNAGADQRPTVEFGRKSDRLGERSQRAD